MGLFNKLKNALFEEEEIDFDVTPEKEATKKEEEPVKEIKKEEPKKEKISLENEKDLFKAENTFNFPDFDEEEFVTNYEPPKKEEVKPIKKVEPRKPKTESLYTENKVKVTQEKTAKRRREKNVIKEEPIKKAFHPSPIISPVYGVLDKNYKKEDIISSEKSAKQTRINDVDSIRKKAFGSLEEDIEKTLSNPMNEFYNEDSRSIDELLNDSIDDTIELNHDVMEDTFEMEYEPKEINRNTNRKKRSNIINSVEESNEAEENLELDEKIPDIEYEEKKNLEDTLENDLFDLIDSMYDDREEE